MRGLARTTPGQAVIAAAVTATVVTAAVVTAAVVTAAAETATAAAGRWNKAMAGIVIRTPNVDQDRRITLPSRIRIQWS